MLSDYLNRVVFRREIIESSPAFSPQARSSRLNGANRFDHRVHDQRFIPVGGEIRDRMFASF